MNVIVLKPFRRSLFQSQTVNFIEVGGEGRVLFSEALNVEFEI